MRDPRFDLASGESKVPHPQARIEKALARRHLENGTLVLYDVTSTISRGAADRSPGSATIATANPTS
jgi:hypothetical protein